MNISVTTDGFSWKIDSISKHFKSNLSMVFVKHNNIHTVCVKMIHKLWRDRKSPSIKFYNKSGSRMLSATSKISYTCVLNVAVTTCNLISEIKNFLSAFY